MNQTLIARYQSGGDIYTRLAGQYGVPAAGAIAAAAQTGDSRNVTDAIAQVRSGSPRDPSVLNALATQLSTDPLAAPFASANGILNNTFISLLKNPTVLAVLAAILFFSLGGAGWVRKKLNA